jgi:endonuclease/exonuclease/phosphatase family metal-dependent hydrolase
VAKALGAVDHRFVPCVVGTPGLPGWTAAPATEVGADRGDHEDGLPAGPSYGIALVSRLPVTRWRLLRLAPPRGRWPLAIPARPPRVMWLSDEPRAVLAAELAGCGVVVAATHLSFVPGVNIRQLRRTRRWLDEVSPGPAVLLGDLNLPGRIPARVTGWTSLATGPTFPAPAPRLQLDHALTRRPPASTHGEIVELPVGDHRAVVVDVDLDVA